MDKTIDVLLYVDRLDAYRVDNLDRQIIKAITDSFGKGIWDRAAVVLTHAQLSPPDGLSYEEFFTKRSESLLKVLRLGARMKKQDSSVWHLHPFFCPFFCLDLYAVIVLCNGLALHFCAFY